MKKRRSLGVTICGYLMIILPLSVYIDSILVIWFNSGSLAMLAGVALRQCFKYPLCLLYQIIWISLGVAVLRLNKSVLRYSFIINIMGFLLGVVGIFLPIPGPFSGTILSIAFCAFFVLFFSLPRVKEQFA